MCRDRSDTVHGARDRANGGTVAVRIPAAGHRSRHGAGKIAPYNMRRVLTLASLEGYNQVRAVIQIHVGDNLSLE